MSQRKLPKAPGSRSPQQGKKPQHRYPGHYYPHYYYDCYDYDWYDYDYDYDWYDYDYDWYDHDYGPRRSHQSKKSKGPRAIPVKQSAGNYQDSCQEVYQQGFKDGWAAAMDYMMYGYEIEESAAAAEATVTQDPAKVEAPKGEVK